MNRAREHVLAVAAGTAACMVACASRSSSAPRPTTEPVLASAAPAASSPAPASAAMPAPAAMPQVLDAGPLAMHTPSTITYDASDGKGQVIAVVEGMPDCHCAARTWWIRSYRTDPHGQAEREARYMFTDDGSIAQIEEIDRVDKVEVVYTPPLVIVPNKLTPRKEGAPGFHQTVKMVVHPLGDRSKVRTSGNATAEVTLVGDERVQTGQGMIVAHKLLSVLTADLSAAKTIDTTEHWWADGLGLVAQKEEEVTRVFGAKVRDNTSTIILQSHADTK